jgi:hypothetical protein
MKETFEQKRRQLLGIRPGQKVCYFSTTTGRNGTKRERSDIVLFCLARRLFEEGRLYLFQSIRYKQNNGAQAIDYIAIGRVKKKE